MAGGLPEDVQRRVVATVAAAYGLSEEEVRTTAAFRGFAGGDSLDLVELVLALDDELRGGGPRGPAFA